MTRAFKQKTTRGSISSRYIGRLLAMPKIDELIREANTFPEPSEEMNIEHGIAPLIETFNSLSFVRTTSSCEGHVYEMMGSWREPVTKETLSMFGTARVKPAEILFEVDGRVSPNIGYRITTLSPESECFLSGLNRFIMRQKRKGNFLILSRYQSYHGEDTKPEYCLSIRKKKQILGKDFRFLDALNIKREINRIIKELDEYLQTAKMGLIESRMI